MILLGSSSRRHDMKSGSEMAKAFCQILRPSRNLQWASLALGTMVYAGTMKGLWGKALVGEMLRSSEFLFQS